MSDTTVVPESLEYRTEVKQLLDILAHSLYTDREIFLRELISNASDALNRIQFETLTNADVVDPHAELAVRILVDEEANTITISDTGIGMNHDELIQNLGTIAHSGAKAFIQQATESKTSLDEIIGQFGVGFYSAFMVAAEMTVTSRSYRPEDSAWTWQSTGDSRFTLTPADKSTRGTEIVIRLKPDAAEFASTWKLQSIIKKHSDYVSFPIYVAKVEPPQEETSAEDAGDMAEDGEKPVNRQTALWRQSASSVKAEEYDEFYKQLTFDWNEPLLHIHMVADAPANIRSILYIPSKRDRGLMGFQNEHQGLKLYSRKVLIQEHNKELLPEHLRFVEGVVDSEDLPLNVSRETVQSNPLIRQIQRALTNRVYRDLKNLADNEPEKYVTFWNEFGMFLKEGVATDPSSRDHLLDLLRFHSSKPTTESADALTTLKEYVARMKVDQSEIYYVLGENLRSVARSPHLDYFRANDIEVLYLVDPIDGFMTTYLRDYDDKPLKNVDDPDLKLPETAADPEEPKEESVAQDEFDKLVARFKEVLDARVTDVRESKQLVSSPCRLVTPEGGFDRDMQRIRRLMGQDLDTPKKLLELNRRHPVIASLAHIVSTSPDDAILNASIEQLFANALLLEGIHPNPADMVSHIETLLEAAVTSRA